MTSSSATIVSTHLTGSGHIVAPTAVVDEALQKVVVKARRGKKSKRDPDAPKRPMGAYMLWLQENRQSIVEEYCSDLSGKERVMSTAKKAGELWKEMTDEEKESFAAKAVTLREEYQELMKEYKPEAGAKAVRVAYDPEEIPETPSGWSGVFEMHYLKDKVKDVDGKTVRIQKVFSEAVKLATEINAAWSVACEEGDIPSHWSADSKPCNGITKTTTGYDLRFRRDLLATRDQERKTGLASWVFGDYTAPTAKATEGQSIYDAETDDEESPKEKKSPEPAEKKDKKEKKEKKAKKAKKSPEPEAEKSPKKLPEPEAEKSPEKPAPKKKVKRMVKKAKKSKYPEEDMEEIEIERDGEDVEFMLHEDSGDVFEKSNLVEPVGKVDDGEIMFF
jgi:hypothetical protein